jgi:hypothetical protein
MKRTQLVYSISRPAVLASILTFVVGCGSESAGSDAEARAQTELDAKNAMVNDSKKESRGVSQQQSTKNAMQAGARQQQSGRK